MHVPETCIIGIDVSKAQLDVAVVPSEETTQFANTDVGIGELVAWVRPATPSSLS
jgi:transposase